MNKGTVYEQMVDTRKGLLDKLCENEEMASVVMGLLARLIFICESEKGKPVTGMTFDAWSHDYGVFKSRVHFNSLYVQRSHMWGAQRDFDRYVGQKAGKLALALSDNPAMGKWFEDLIEAVNQYALDKGFLFKNLTFTKHIITNNDVVVLEVGRRPDVKLRY